MVIEQKTSITVQGVHKMALGVRGSNPIWAEFDLAGNLFDDNYYMYVLENVLPYVPAAIYHDPDLSVPRANPVQFLGNGTLPNDIFYAPDKVYRLEFRQNNGLQAPSQNDPLIYEVNDYVPNSGGSNPVDTVAFPTSNQITNPQFSIVSFNETITLASVTNPDPIEIAPGWFLELAGTGSATIQRQAFNNSNQNPSNAPYALELNLTGWNTGGVILRQRFQQNGMLWANKIVSSAVTAAIIGVPQGLTATLVDSNGSLLAEVLNEPSITQDLLEYTGLGELDISTNPDTPPAAYVDYRLNIPSNVNILLTSFQLVVQDLPLRPAFEQDTIDRQIDHTWHYYKDSVLLQPKESILTGWQFALNPYQFTDPAIASLANNAYVADQTIIVQQNYVATATGNNVQTGRATAALNYGFQVTAATSTNQFANIQYIDTRTVRPYWGYKMSSLVRLNVRKQNTQTLRVKMMLAYRTTLPSTIGQNEPVLSWTAGQTPVLAAGWTAVNNVNDRVYSVVNGVNVLAFDGFQLPAATTADQTLAVIIYTIDNMVQTGTPDAIIFDKVSLVPNDFSIEANSETWDSSLRKCFYHYESSFPQGVAAPAINIGGSRYFLQRTERTGVPLSDTLLARSFSIEYLVPKRATPSTFNLYSGFSTTPGLVEGYLLRIGASNFQSEVTVTSFWDVGNISDKSASYLAKNNNVMLTIGAAGTMVDSLIAAQFTADSRLGV